MSLCEFGFFDSSQFFGSGTLSAFRINRKAQFKTVGLTQPPECGHEGTARRHGVSKCRVMTDGNVGLPGISANEFVGIVQRTPMEDVMRLTTRVDAQLTNGFGV